MIFAVTFSLFLIGLVGIVFSRRNKYFYLKTQIYGSVKDGIVYLPTKNITNKKLVTEVKFFNELNLVMPMNHGVAVFYTEQLCVLLKNPKHSPSDDAYEKLLYGYACYVLLSKTTDEIIRNQLKKNLLFLFAPKRKIVKKIKPVLSYKKYNLYPQPIYKIFNNTFLDFSLPEFETKDKLKIMNLDSYVKYYNDNITIKRFENFYELKSRGEQKVVFLIANDKSNYDCSVARSTVSIKNLSTGESKTYSIHGDKIRLSTSVCEKTDALKIYLTFDGDVGVSVDGGKKRLLYRSEIEFNRNVELIVEQAYKCKYVSGEKLRARYKVAESCVPTLKLLTVVKEIKNAEDFVSVLDKSKFYKKTASLFGGFNIVFLYSSGNRFVADLVSGFISRQEIDELRTAKVFMFFIDRTTAEPDALYFLTKMTRPSKYSSLLPCCGIESVSKTFPYVRTVTISNNTCEPVNISTNIPLIFSSQSVVSVEGQTLKVVGLYSGRVSIYKLPVSINIENELLTDSINIPIKTKLMGYQEKKFNIQRNDNIMTNKERKENFIASLENIIIKTEDKQLNKIFALTIVDGENVQLADLVKTAYKNVDKKLLISLLEDKHSLTFDVWQFLISKVIGIKLLRGKVHLVPCVNIVGDFSVEFTCNGVPYTFSTKKCFANSNKFVTLMHG